MHDVSAAKNGGGTGHYTGSSCTAAWAGAAGELEKKFGLPDELSGSQVVKYSMTDHYFDTLEYARQLQAAGVPEGQAGVHAKALAHVLEKCLSTAGETADLKNELSFKMSGLEVTLRAEIRELETKLRGEIKESDTRVRAELGGRIDKLEAAMQEGFRWQWWANGLMVAMLIGLYFR